MSHQTYNKLWDLSDRQLRDLALAEADPTQFPDKKDKEGQFEYYALLYLKYIQIFRNLASSYDQIVHPQKRRVLKTLVDGAMGRVLELKHVLVEMECSDYHFFDELLADLKLTPDDIELTVPLYFRRENEPQLKAREKILDSVDAARIDPNKKPDLATLPTMSREEALRYVQSHERARQGRIRAKFQQDIRMRAMRDARRKKISNMTEGVAAVQLQKYIRGWLTRRHIIKQVKAEDLLIGMTQPPPLDPDNNPIIEMENTIYDRHAKQDENEQRYQAALNNIRSKVWHTEGPDMKENMSDEIREWFNACRDQTGSYPDFPDAVTGGSKAVFDPPPPPVVVEDDADADGKKGKGKKKAKGSGKKDKGKKGKKKGKKGDEEEDDGPKGPAPSAFLPILHDASDVYQGEWRKYAPDAENIEQKHDATIIKTQKRLEVENELRLQVDELMREELKNMKAENAKAKKAKGKSKKAKSKKGKGKGKGKGKKDKDLTADRTPESLFEELAKNQIAKRIPELTIQQLVGQYSFLGVSQKQLSKEPEPSMADVRRVVTLYSVLPLASQAVHELQSHHVKSMLLVGHKGVGKKSLATAIAHDLGANFFDLTPENTFGKYTGKKLDGVEGMLHITFKMAKLYQPSVIFIGDAASVHLKKSKEFESTRMKKELPKCIKKLSPGDRVIVIGADDAPYDADMKTLSTVYQKIVRVPLPDYGTRMMLWQTILTQEGVTALPQNFDLSSLTKISDGYTAGDITTCVREVLTPRRVQAQAQKPLAPTEMIPGLAKLTPVSPTFEAELKTWMTKTPLGKAREKLLKPDDDGDGDKKGKGKKGKGKGKKKK